MNGRRGDGDVSPRVVCSQGIGRSICVWDCDSVAFPHKTKSIFRGGNPRSRVGCENPTHTGPASDDGNRCRAKNTHRGDRISSEHTHRVVGICASRDCRGDRRTDVVSDSHIRSRCRIGDWRPIASPNIRESGLGGSPLALVNRECAADWSLTRESRRTRGDRIRPRRSRLNGP